MTLRTVAVPDPAPGVDWATVVPGIYTYDVTGITALLTTSGDTPAVAVDSSGNGLDGAYGYSFGYPVSVAGLVPGDTAKQFADPAVVDATPGQVGIPVLGFDMADSWSVAWFMRPATVHWNGPVVTFFSSVAPETVRIGGDNSGVGFGVLRFNGVDDDGAGYDLSAFFDGSAHFFVVCHDGADFHLWVDGVEQTPTVVLPPIALTPGADWSGITCDDGINTGLNATLDELSVHQIGFTQGDVDSLFGASGDITSYTAAVLGALPVVYYHLDDVSPGTARQVLLEVFTTTGDVADICSGFPLGSGAGPYTYSWQPHLASSTQTPDGGVTTVAIPRLILPAGYTVAARTLDLAAGDQWSNVTLWWDDAFMLAGATIDPYVYPPGVKLVYRPEGAHP